MDVRKETFRSSLQHNDSSVQPTDRSGATSLRATQVGVEEKKLQFVVITGRAVDGGWE